MVSVDTLRLCLMHLRNPGRRPHSPPYNPVASPSCPPEKEWGGNRCFAIYVGIYLKHWHSLLNALEEGSIDGSSDLLIEHLSDAPCGRKFECWESHDDWRCCRSSWLGWTCRTCRNTRCAMCGAVCASQSLRLFPTCTSCEHADDLEEVYHG